MKVAVVYYSTWGHMAGFAKSVAEGVNMVDGCEAVLYQVPETLPPEVLEKMHAPPKNNDPIATPDVLEEADAILFGIATRFGSQNAQMRAFFDSTGSLWQAGKLVGKPAGIFFGTGTQGGGQETTALTTVPFLVHHGMVYVPMGYTFGGEFFDNSAVRGGSPYGPGYYAGADGSRAVSELESRVAVHYGTYFAGVAKKLAA